MAEGRPAQALRQESATMYANAATATAATAAAAAAAELAWADADHALRLLVEDPGLGGLWLRGAAGPVRDAWLARLRQALPAGTPWRRVPLQIDDSGLCGGLDLAASLAAARPVQRAGLLAEADGGVLLLAMAERTPPELAARLAAALDAAAGRLRLVALDEGRPGDEALPPVLAERLALVLDLDRLSGSPSGGAKVRAVGSGEAETACAAALDLTVNEAGVAPPAFPLPDFDAVAADALCSTAQALGLHSLRPALQAWRVARQAAAWAGRQQVGQHEAELAARLVLAPRARAVPAAAEVPADAPTDPSTDAPAPADDPASGSPAAGDSPPPPRADPQPVDAHDAAPSRPEPPATTAPPDAQALITAATAALPAGLLAALAGKAAVAGRAGAGRSAQGRFASASRAASGGRAGRVTGLRRGLPRGHDRLDLLATLRAAVPWQALRQHERHQAGLPPPATRLLLRPGDVCVRRRARKPVTTTLFVVDASGSQALHRLAEAKGAVERLLADCYVRRDQVALIAFGGTRAELLLPPTRSLVRARRSLAVLPGGGGTPLALGLGAALDLAQALRQREAGRVQLVLLTDGRANIDRQGQPGREAAQRDALAAARALAASGLPSLLIDTAPRPQPEARGLAAALGGAYLALPLGRSAQVSAAVSALSDGLAG